MSEASALLKHLVCIWAGAKFRGPLVHPTGSITAVQINARGNGITGSGLQSANAQKELHGCSRRSGDSNKVPEQLPDAFLRKIIIAPSLQPHMCSRVATGDTWQSELAQRKAASDHRQVAERRGRSSEKKLLIPAWRIGFQGKYAIWTSGNWFIHSVCQSILRAHLASESTSGPVSRSFIQPWTGVCGERMWDWTGFPLSCGALLCIFLMPTASVQDARFLSW